MQLDMDLIRKLLIAIESPSFDPGSIPVIDGYEEETVGHHVFLLGDAGFVDGARVDGYRYPRALATHLTWNGHQALAAIRNETVWQKTKARVAKVGNATIPLWIEIAAAVAKEQLGLGDR